VKLLSEIANWSIIWCYAMELSFYQIVRFAAPNIMVGNTILLKHASMVPQCGIAMEELFKEAQAPEGLHQSIDFGKKKYRFSE
jgi:acyl-CoA reductase-like NAD-dependent aldehyde dehydrogenase